MNIVLTEVQVKTLTQMLVNYFNGRSSIASEAQAIQELVNAIQVPVTETKAPSEVTETKSDGAKKK